MNIEKVKRDLDKSGLSIIYKNYRASGEAESASFGWPDDPAPSLVKAFNKLRMIIVDECYIPIEIIDSIHITEVVFKDTDIGKTIKLKATVRHSDLAISEFKLDVVPLIIARLPKEGEDVIEFIKEIKKYLKGYKLQVGMFKEIRKTDKPLIVEIRPTQQSDVQEA